MTDVEIMNYFLQKKKEELKVSELTVTDAGEIQIIIGEYDGNFYTPELFNSIKTDIGRTYQIQTNTYSGTVTLIVQGKEVGNNK